MSIKRIKRVSLDSDIKNLPDTLVGQSIYLKGYFDKNTYQLLDDCINPLIDELSATTSGDSGADSIGSGVIDGVIGDTVQAKLESLKSITDNIVMGQIPDSSITPSKLSAGYARSFEATVLYSGGVYNIDVPLDGYNGVYSCTFIAPTTFVATDSYSVNGSDVTLKSVSGKNLSACWVKGAVVQFFISGDVAFFNLGGAELTGNATAADVLSGSTFYSNNSDQKLTGTLSLSGNATTADVLTGVTFYGTNAKSKQTGTLALSGNATAAEVLSGSTFYSTNPKSKLTGTLALSGNATAADVLSGATFYSNNAKSKLTGTLALSGNATASDVRSGKTFYSANAKTKLTGTMAPNGAMLVTVSGQIYVPAGYNGEPMEVEVGLPVIMVTWKDDNLGQQYRLEYPMTRTVLGENHVASNYYPYGEITNISATKFYIRNIAYRNGFIHGTYWALCLR